MINNLPGVGELHFEDFEDFAAMIIKDISITTDP